MPDNNRVCGWCRDPYCTGDHSGDAAPEPWPGSLVMPADEFAMVEAVVRCPGCRFPLVVAETCQACGHLRFPDGH